MPRRDCKFVDSYFGKPWIQPFLATFDLKKAEYVVTPGHVVTQIIKVKEGCPESLRETDQNIYGSADLHDSYVRANAVFTTEAIEEFEKYEEAVSGCEFEHLPFSILLLKKFHVIPQITEQLRDCNLVICIEEFSLVVNEGPMHKISSLPWAKTSCSVTFNLHRLWSTAHGDCNEESGTEPLTNSDPTFSGGDLSQLLAEVKKDLSLLQSSHSGEDTQSRVASQPQVSLSDGPVTDEPDPGSDQQDPSPSGLTSKINYHTPDKPRDSPLEGQDQGEFQGTTSEKQSENIEENLKWRHVHQLASWVFSYKIHSSSFVSTDVAGRDRMEEVVKQVTRCIEKLPDRDGLDGDENEEDLATKEASPVPKSPFSCKRKSRRGRRQSPLAQKPGVLRGDSVGSEGQDREERLMFERISRELPTTELIILAPEDIIPLPSDYGLDDDEDDYSPFLGDMNNNLHLQEWDGDYAEVEEQPTNTNLNITTSFPEGSKHIATSSTPPAMTASKELFPEPEHPPGMEKPLQKVLQETEDLFGSDSETLGGNVAIGDPSSLNDEDDDETQLPTWPPAETSTATVSDSSQSDFHIDMSGQSDFTLLRCSIDDRMQKENATDGTGDHVENLDGGFGSDSDIFILSEKSTEPVESCDDVTVSPKTSLRVACEVNKGKNNNSRNNKLTADNDSTEHACAGGGDGEMLRGVGGTSRKRKQRIISGDTDKKKSTEKRIRFAEPEPRSMFLDESLDIDSIPFGGSHRVWTSTQKDGNDAAVFMISSEEEPSEREQFDKQVTGDNSSAVSLSGWISKQCMMSSKRRTEPGVKATRENESEETDVTDTPNTDPGKDGKQNSSEDSVILLSSGSQVVDSFAVDTQETNALVKDHSHSLVSSEPSEGSAKDSDKTGNFSVTPVLFSSGESTKASHPDGTQLQNQMPLDKTDVMKDSRVEGESNPFCDAAHDSNDLDEEEPMSIDTPDDSLPFSAGDTALPVSSAEVKNNLNSPEDTFARIKHVSVSGSGRCILKETRPESCSGPPDPHSIRSSTPPEKVTESHFQAQKTHRTSEGNPDTPRKSLDNPGTSNQEEDASSLEQRKMTKNLPDNTNHQTTHSVQSSKIYMGSSKMRQLTRKKKKKLLVTQATPSSISKNVLTMKCGADSLTTPNTHLPPGQTSGKLQSVVERKATKDTPMDSNDFSISDVRTPCLGKFPTSGKTPVSNTITKTKSSIQASRNRDKSDSFPEDTVCTTKTIRVDCPGDGRTRSDGRRRRSGCHGDDDVEPDLMSPVSSLQNPDQDENLPSSLNDSVLNGTSLPSSDDSGSTLGEEALLDWCAMYLLKNSKR